MKPLTYVQWFTCLRCGQWPRSMVESDQYVVVFYEKLCPDCVVARELKRMRKEATRTCPAG
jgi:hypothetical protein